MQAADQLPAPAAAQLLAATERAVPDGCPAERALQEPRPPGLQAFRVCRQLANAHGLNFFSGGIRLTEPTVGWVWIILANHRAEGLRIRSLVAGSMVESPNVDLNP